MYIWKIDRLNEDLVAEEISEREKFKYLIACAVLYLITIYPFSGPISDPNIYDRWSEVRVAVVTLFGLFLIYKCNGGDNGRDLLIRYLSISWVVFIRMIVLLMLPTAIALFVVQEIYMGGVPDETTSIDFAYMTVIEIVYVFWVAKHINRVARASNAQQNLS